jgi:hypothetical protein
MHWSNSWSTVNPLSRIVAMWPDFDKPPKPRCKSLCNHQDVLAAMMSSERLGSGSGTGPHGGQQRDTAALNRCVSQHTTHCQTTERCQTAQCGLKMLVALSGNFPLFSLTKALP